LNMNDLPSLLRNDGGNKQNWIKIKLIGTKCNRTAIGARVRVATGDHVQMDEGDGDLSAEVTSAYRYQNGKSASKAPSQHWSRVHLVPFAGHMGVLEITAGKIQEYRL